MKKITFKNILYYIQGWCRYGLYYSKILYGIDLSWLIRKHIHQQIDVRIDSMNRQCYLEGSCKECGCATTALQMCNKSCEGMCYPAMMNKKDWNSFLKHKVIKLKNRIFWFYIKGKFKRYEKLGK